MTSHTPITHPPAPRTADARPAAAAPLRTPYHSLSGADEMLVPDWAQRRSVYRSSGRTLYVVETDRLTDARSDLKRLDRAGWNVTVSELPSSERARIALTRKELARAA
ncbi:hypothetical protein [Leucobacter chromiiresistens]|uniref:Uncharacterized protein n=1 Tax=Leucobacter chromiiresistens TaxID=1079994 RepID=A0A147ESI4_9MICO|nr:hypothetical protein [Leucobacter chromiiresistens]KTR87430.1 hypothetical protein NS354_00195 [Leucobacter chromiiresistens]